LGRLSPAPGAASPSDVIEFGCDDAEPLPPLDPDNAPEPGPLPPGNPPREKLSVNGPVPNDDCDADCWKPLLPEVGVDPLPLVDPDVVSDPVLELPDIPLIKFDDDSYKLPLYKLLVLPTPAKVFP
jgi:hypothetical protein